MKKNLICISLILIGFASCKKTHPTPVSPALISLPADVPGTAITLDSFPLKIGNQWVYRIITQTTKSESPLSSGTASLSLSTPDSGFLTVGVVSDTLINGFRLYGLSIPSQSAFFTYNSIYLSDSFLYANLTDGLHRITAGGNTDSNYVLDSTEALIKLPVAMNTKWSYNYVTRQWTDYVTVTTPAGKFDCVKLSVTENMGSDLYGMVQYYSSKGLIQELQWYTSWISAGPGVHDNYTYYTMLTLQSLNF